MLSVSIECIISSVITTAVVPDMEYLRIGVSTIGPYLKLMARVERQTRDPETRPEEFLIL
jgi:hypothetical protein